MASQLPSNLVPIDRARVSKIQWHKQSRCLFHHHTSFPCSQLRPTTTTAPSSQLFPILRPPLPSSPPFYVPNVLQVAALSGHHHSLRCCRGLRRLGLADIQAFRSLWTMSDPTPSQNGPVFPNYQQARGSYQTTGYQNHSSAGKMDCNPFKTLANQEQASTLTARTPWATWQPSKPACLARPAPKA